MTVEEIDQVIAAKRQLILDCIAQESLAIITPQFSYSIDGQSVNKGEYLRWLTELQNSANKVILEQTELRNTQANILQPFQFQSGVR